MATWLEITYAGLVIAIMILLVIVVIFVFYKRLTSESSRPKRPWKRPVDNRRRMRRFLEVINRANEDMIDRGVILVNFAPVDGGTEEGWIDIFRELAFNAAIGNLEGDAGLAREATVVPDSQNVHDSNVNKELNSKYLRIKELNEKEITEDFGEDAGTITDENLRAQSLIEIHKMIADRTKEGKLSELDAEHITNLLETIVMNKSITSIEDGKECDIMANVWRRMHSKDNIENQKNMEEMFITMLKECHEESILGGTHMVCINGRVSRIIDSLTMLDSDKIISAPMKTTQIIKNEAFNKTLNILNTELKDMDPELKKAYENMDFEEDMKKEGKSDEEIANIKKKLSDFEKKIKDKVSETLRKDYSSKLSKEKLEELIKQAHSGLEFT